MDTGTKNRLDGAWHRLTGGSQMVVGAQFDDPELFFSGVVNAVQGRLQEKIGAHQAQRFSDALRMRWDGQTRETKGQILKQWGEWADDPEAMAEGVTDLAQGKVQRYAGATALHVSSGLSDNASTLNNKTADAARQALASIFAGNTTDAKAEATA